MKERRCFTILFMVRGYHQHWGEIMTRLCGSCGDWSISKFSVVAPQMPWANGFGRRVPTQCGGGYFQNFPIKAVNGRLMIKPKADARVTRTTQYRPIQMLVSGIIGPSENIARRMENSMIAATISNLVSCFMRDYLVGIVSTNHA